ncbi:MAG: TIGR01244 family phosphatase [Ottowia sp.]|nr:TIGR01244 family phosphatase [Ottowia sp.]
MSTSIRLATDWFGFCGQLQPDDLQAVAQQGFCSVINNRPDGERGDQPTAADIGAAAQSAGLTYVHFPIESGAPILEENILEMKRLVEILPKPILAFCFSGARSNYIFQLALAPA